MQFSTLSINLLQESTQDTKNNLLLTRYRLSTRLQPGYCKIQKNVQLKIGVSMDLDRWSKIPKINNTLKVK